MATYLVRRPFMAPEGVLEIGTILRSPSWPERNIKALVAIGKLEVVADESEAAHKGGETGERRIRRKA